VGTFIPPDLQKQSKGIFGYSGEFSSSSAEMTQHRNDSILIFLMIILS